MAYIKINNVDITDSWLNSDDLVIFEENDIYNANGVFQNLEIKIKYISWIAQELLQNKIITIEFDTSYTGRMNFVNKINDDIAEIKKDRYIKFTAVTFFGNVKDNNIAWKFLNDEIITESEYNNLSEFEKSEVRSLFSTGISNINEPIGEGYIQTRELLGGAGTIQEIAGSRFFEVSGFNVNINSGETIFKYSNINISKILRSSEIVCDFINRSFFEHRVIHRVDTNEYRIQPRVHLWGLKLNFLLTFEYNTNIVRIYAMEQYMLWEVVKIEMGEEDIVQNAGTITLPKFDMVAQFADSPSRLWYYYSFVNVLADEIYNYRSIGSKIKKETDYKKWVNDNKVKTDPDAVDFNNSQYIYDEIGGWYTANINTKYVYDKYRLPETFIESAINLPVQDIYLDVQGLGLHDYKYEYDWTYDNKDLGLQNFTYKGNLFFQRFMYEETDVKMFDLLVEMGLLTGKRIITDENVINFINYTTQQIIDISNIKSPVGMPVSNLTKDNNKIQMPITEFGNILQRHLLAYYVDISGFTQETVLEYINTEELRNLLNFTNSFVKNADDLGILKSYEIRKNIIRFKAEKGIIL